MLATVGSLASLLLGATFAWASLAKVFGWRRWRRALTHYRLAPRGEEVAAVAVPVTEAGTCALLMTGTSRIGCALALAVVSGFSIAIVRARFLGGDALPCGCFGGDGAIDFRRLLLRNAVLGAAAAFVLVAGGVKSPTPSLSQMAPVLLVATGLLLVLWVVVHTRASLRR
jgi:hypothetical protein